MQENCQVRNIKESGNRFSLTTPHNHVPQYEAYRARQNLLNASIAEPEKPLNALMSEFLTADEIDLVDSVFCKLLFVLK